MSTVETIKVDEEILLRWPSMADAEELFKLIDTNREHLGRWLPWVDAIQSLDDEKGWIETTAAAKAKGQEWPPLIIYRDSIVGAIGTDTYFDPLHKVCGIGYWLAVDYQGRGIVTWACSAVINHLFGPLGMNRVQLRISPGNERSVAIAQRLGFVFEGVSRQSWLVNGQFLDMAVYSVLASEWRSRGASRA
ncbi:MAG: GNAT family protein [Chloroflexi bacterium]|nr:GNAT family protein [Chloroflexota bacterium]